MLYYMHYMMHYMMYRVEGIKQPRRMTMLSQAMLLPHTSLSFCPYPALWILSRASL